MFDDLLKKILLQLDSTHYIINIVFFPNFFSIDKSINLLIIAAVIHCVLSPQF